MQEVRNCVPLDPKNRVVAKHQNRSSELMFLLWNFEVKMLTVKYVGG